MSTSTQRSRELEDDAPRLRLHEDLPGILVPVLNVLLIGAVFVAVYLAAFHAPKADHIPVAVVGDSRQVTSVETYLTQHVPGQYSVRQYTDPDRATTALENRTVFASYDLAATPPRLEYAGANGIALGQDLRQVFTGAGAGVSGAGAGALQVDNVVPTTAGDTRGLSIFYCGFGLVVASFLFGTISYQLAPRLSLRRRLGSLALFAVLGGAVVTTIARAYHSLPGNWFGLAAVLGMTAAASGAASLLFSRLFHGLGTTIGAIVLMIFGNSTSGGNLPAAFLPAWLHPLNEILPVGVGVKALYGVAYFNGDAVARGFVVLAAWVLGCAAVITIADLRERRATRQPPARHLRPHDGRQPAMTAA